jgi:hypothetical protein
MRDGGRQLHSQWLQPFGIVGSDLDPALDGIGEMPQHDSQACGLQLVQSAIPPFGMGDAIVAEYLRAADRFAVEERGSLVRQNKAFDVSEIGKLDYVVADNAPTRLILNLEDSAGSGVDGPSCRAP